MKSVLVAFSIVLGFAAPSLANTCTTEDIQKLAVELRSVAQKDMKRFQEIANEMQQKSVELQASKHGWFKGAVLQKSLSSLQGSLVRNFGIIRYARTGEVRGKASC